MSDTSINENDTPVEEPVEVEKKEFVTKTDPVTGDKIQIPKSADIYLGHVTAQIRKSLAEEIESKYTPLLEQIKNENAELSGIKDEYEKLKLENLTADERAKQEAKKLLDTADKKVKDALDEAALWKQRHSNAMIKNEIFTAMSSTELCNAEQTAQLMMSEGNAFVREKSSLDGKPTGEFEVIVTLQVANDKGELSYVEGTPTELFKGWINRPNNLYQLKRTLNAGGGSGNPRVTGNGRDYAEMIKNPAQGLSIIREDIQNK